MVGEQQVYLAAGLSLYNCFSLTSENPSDSMYYLHVNFANQRGSNFLGTRLSV